MEDEAPSQRSVAELAGRFKGSAPPQNAAGNGAEKPVRRRPPRTLQLPKPQGDDQEPPGVTSPLPAKAKRNSALIEKLQANLALSPSALSPKSPGFRLLPPSFTPASPGSAPVTTAPASSSATPTSPVTVAPATEEEGPASFEAPPTAAEGSILSSINKGRPRHSIRRRPPSRRHRKSSCGDDATETQPTEDGQEGPTDVSTPTEGHQTQEEDETKSNEVKKEKDETKSNKVKKDEDETKSNEVKKDEDETKSNEVKKDEDETKSNKVKKEEDETKSNEVKKDEDETKSNEVKKDEDETNSNKVKKEEDGSTGGDQEKQDSAEAETKTDDRKEKDSEEATTSAR